MEEISFTKEEIIDLLAEWTDFLYETNPPKEHFNDNSLYLHDFVDGYFSQYFQPERSKREDVRVLI